MTPSRAEVRLALAGAVRLFAFKPEGFGFVAQDAAGAWRSFFALVLAAPAFFFSLERLRLDMRLEEPGLHFYGVWALIYLILWFAFPLLLLKMSEQQPFAPKVPAYIACANWVSVPAVYIDFLADLAGRGGLLPMALLDALEFGLLCWFLAVQWWLLRRLLGIAGLQAAALVMLSEGISFGCFLWGFTRTALPAVPG